MEIDQLIPGVLFLSFIIVFLTIKLAGLRRPAKLVNAYSHQARRHERRGALALNPIISCAMPFYNGAY